MGKQRNNNKWLHEASRASIMPNLMYRGEQIRREEAKDLTLDSLSDDVVRDMYVQYLVESGSKEDFALQQADEIDADAMRRALGIDGGMKMAPVTGSEPYPAGYDETNIPNEGFDINKAVGYAGRAGGVAYGLRTLLAAGYNNKQAYSILDKAKKAGLSQNEIKTLARKMNVVNRNKLLGYGNQVVKALKPGSYTKMGMNPEDAILQTREGFWRTGAKSKTILPEAIVSKLWNIKEPVYPELEPKIRKTVTPTEGPPKKVFTKATDYLPERYKTGVSPNLPRTDKPISVLNAHGDPVLVNPRRITHKGVPSIEFEGSMGRRKIRPFDKNIKAVKQVGGVYGSGKNVYEKLDRKFKGHNIQRETPPVKSTKVPTSAKEVSSKTDKASFKERFNEARRVLIGKGDGNLGIVPEPFNRGHHKYTPKTVAKPKSNLRSIGGTVGSVAGAVTMAPYISDEIQNVRKGKGLGAVAYDNVTGLPLLPLILAEAGEKLVKGRLPWKDSWSQEPTSIGPVIEKTHEFMEGVKDYVLMDKSVRERKRDVSGLESESDWGQGVIYEAPKKNMLGMYYDDKNLFGKRKEVKSNAPIYSSMKKEIHDAITKPNKASGQKALSDLVHAYNLEHGLYDTKDEMTTKKAMDIVRKVYTKKYKKK